MPLDTPKHTAPSATQWSNIVLHDTSVTPPDITTQALHHATKVVLHDTNVLLHDISCAT
jgi:hypothetical protein